MNKKSVRIYSVLCDICRSCCAYSDVVFGTDRAFYCFNCVLKNSTTIVVEGVEEE